MSRCIAACCLALLAAVPARAQAPAPIRLALHPAAPGLPALRYRLLPDLIGQRPGNAAELYKKAVPLLQKVSDEDDEQMQEWEKLPPEQLPCAEVRKVLGAYKQGLELIERAARCEHCDWGLAERLRKQGFGFAMPEVQPMRVAARLLALRVRVAVAEDKFEPAVQDLRTGLALARHMGEAPTLIMGQVGNAIAGNMATEVQRFVARPKAPNLYWPLTDLPRPFLDLRTALQSERIVAHRALTGSATDLNGPLTEAQARNYSRMFLGLLGPPDAPGGRARLALRLRQEYKADKEALIAAGRPRELVEKMPHVQVAVLRAFVEYDRASDEMLKWQTFPHAEALPRLRAARARLKAESKRSDVSLAFQLAGLLLSGFDRVLASRVFTDRQFAALRCVEAVRLYAAAHGGKLPPTLGAIKEVPVPDDPFTGKPFEYSVKGDRATLHAPPPDGDKPNRSNTLTYELTLKR